MPSTLQKTLQEQLGGHVRLHLDNPELTPIRVLDSVARPLKKSMRASHLFEIVAKLEAYSGPCGSVARSGIANLRPAGTVLLVESSSGQALHVELGGSGKQTAVTRVSSGGTASDFAKAIQVAGTRSGVRGRGWELRVLRVAAMHLSAVWVHHLNRLEADAFIPYTHNFAGLKIGRAYTKLRIERLLKQHATHMILRWYESYERTITKAKA